MGKCCDIVDGAGLINLCLFFNGGCHVIDTAYSRDDPDFVADTHPAAVSFVAFKEAVFCSGKFSRVLMIRIGEKLAQACLHIMCMNPGAWGNILLSQSDWGAVLDDCLTCPDVLQGKLVPLGNIL